MNEQSCADKPGWRDEILPEDISQIHGLCRAAGNFSTQEMEVAVEVAADGLRKGSASGYYFIFAEERDMLTAFACYGPIACTAHSWELFWIVANPKIQGKGWGGRLLAEVERRVLAAGGQRIYVDTSSRNDYQPARTLYESHGYRLEAALADFYQIGDDKLIYCKVLSC